MNATLKRVGVANAHVIFANSRAWNSRFANIFKTAASNAASAWLADAEGRGLKTHYGHHMLDCQVELIGVFIGAL